MSYYIAYLKDLLLLKLPSVVLNRMLASSKYTYVCCVWATNLVDWFIQLTTCIHWLLHAYSSLLCCYFCTRFTLEYLSILSMCTFRFLVVITLAMFLQSWFTFKSMMYIMYTFVFLVVITFAISLYRLHLRMLSFLLYRLHLRTLSSFVHVRLPCCDKDCLFFT